MSTAASETSTDTASAAVPTQNKVLALSFNQDATAFAIGTTHGYALFTITQNNTSDNNVECGFKPVVPATDELYRDVRIIERVFFSSFIAIVTVQAPRRLYVIKIDKDGDKYRNEFSTDILAVKFSRSRIVVCLEKSISLFELRTLRVLHTIDLIAPNPNGVCAVSANKEKPYLAYPASATTGDIQIFNVVEMKEGILIHAHNGQLAAMSFDLNGEKIASASVKGTVIRVHSTLDGSSLFEFRRGLRRFATIYSLAFSPDATFLATSSNTETIHIFRLNSPTASASEDAGIWSNSVGWMMGNRSFATVQLPTAGVKTTIAMNSLNGKLILFVAGYDGVVFTYEVNTNGGGECKQLTRHTLTDVCPNSKSMLLSSDNLEQSKVDKLVAEYPPNMIQNDNQSTLTTEDTTFYSVKNSMTEQSNNSN